MFFLNWNHFKNDNKKLHAYLGFEPDAEINLQYSNGFFISPDDYINRRSHFPKILLPKSIIEIFREKYSKIFEVVENFYRIVGGFDRLDHMKFKYGAKIAFFYAGAYFIYINKLKDLKEINCIYKKPYQENIENNLLTYLKEFVELAAQRKILVNIWSLFKFAIELSRESSVNLAFPSEFNKLTTFLRSPKYYPYGNIIGSAFETEVQEILEKIETNNEHYLAKFIQSTVHENGVLIPLDEDEQFRSLAAKKANGISVPDYIFVTAKHIYPIDLKVNLDFAKEQQIDGNNLRNLFKKLEEYVKIIFEGLTIEGHYIQPRKQELQQETRDKKSWSP